MPSPTHGAGPTPPRHITRSSTTARMSRRNDGSLSQLPEKLTDDGLPCDDGAAARRAASRPERNGQPVSALRSHSEPSFEMMLDSIFDSTNFRNEIVWKRTSAHSAAQRWNDVHDTLLFYAKSNNHT